MRQGSNTSSAEQLIEKAVKNNVYSAEKIATGDKDEMNVIATVAARSTTLSVAEKQALVDNAHKALTDPILGAKVGKNRENVENIRNNMAPSGPSNPPLI